MKTTHLHIGLLFLFLACSCGPTSLPDPQIAIQKELNIKLSEFLSTRKDDCRLSAILDAEIYIDSVIYEMTRFSALEDSIEMISKPTGPSRPSYIKIVDKGAIVPFPIDTTEIEN